MHYFLAPKRASLATSLAERSSGSAPCCLNLSAAASASLAASAIRLSVALGCSTTNTFINLLLNFIAFSAQTSVQAFSSSDRVRSLRFTTQRLKQSSDMWLYMVRMSLNWDRPSSYIGALFDPKSLVEVNQAIK